MNHSVGHVSTCPEECRAGMAGTVVPTGSDAEVVRLSAVQISQGAVVDSGVADCRVAIGPCGCQLVGSGHWRVSPRHSGTAVLT